MPVKGASYLKGNHCALLSHIEQMLHLMSTDRFNTHFKYSIDYGVSRADATLAMGRAAEEGSRLILTTWGL